MYVLTEAQAGGNSGSYMVKSLLETGKHTVTAVTRQDSTTKLPEGVAVARVDYARPETIVEALRGQDALIVTLGVSASKDTDRMLVQAAADAGVPWIMPNEWGPDNEDEGARRDIPGFAPKSEHPLFPPTQPPTKDWSKGRRKVDEEEKVEGLTSV